MFVVTLLVGDPRAGWADSGWWSGAGRQGPRQRPGRIRRPRRRPSPRPGRLPRHRDHPAGSRPGRRPGTQLPGDRGADRHRHRHRRHGDGHRHRHPPHPTPDPRGDPHAGSTRVRQRTSGPRSAHRRAIAAEGTPDRDRLPHPPPPSRAPPRAERPRRGVAAGRGRRPDPGAPAAGTGGLGGAGHAGRRAALGVVALHRLATTRSPAHRGRGAGGAAGPDDHRACCWTCWRVCAGSPGPRS